MLDGICHYELEVYSEREKESTQNEHGASLASGMVSFSDALCFRMGWGRVGTGQGSGLDIGSGRNPPVGYRTTPESKGIPCTVHLYRPSRKGGGPVEE